VPALQVGSSDFKPQSHQKKKSNKQIKMVLQSYILMAKRKGGGRGEKLQSKTGRAKRRGNARDGRLLFILCGQEGLYDTLSFGQRANGGDDDLPCHSPCRTL
jgi:hypothetical protein